MALTAPNKLQVQKLHGAAIHQVSPWSTNCLWDSVKSSIQDHQWAAVIRSVLAVITSIGRGSFGITPKNDSFQKQMRCMMGEFFLQPSMAMLSANWFQKTPGQLAVFPFSFYGIFLCMCQALFYFLFSFFYWRIIAWQYCVSFCHTSTWISHRYTYAPSLLNLLPTSHSIPPLWKWKSPSHVRLFTTPWIIQFVEFSRPEYWSG